MDTTIFFTLWAGIIGVLVGSFLNVVALRSPRRMFWQWSKDSIECLHQHAPEYLDAQWRGDNEDVYERFDRAMAESKPAGVVLKASHCPSCQHPLSWYHNVPVLSFLCLRGKCAFCKTSISWQYPAVEIAMGLLAASAVFVGGVGFYGLALAVFFGVLLVLSVIDFHTQYLPDHILLPTLWGALLFSLTPYAKIGPEHAILGAALGYLFLWSIFWIFKILTKKDGMGYGDFKLLALIGAFLGPTSLLPTVLIASVLGSIVGIGYFIIHKRSMPFAFGPYLALGGIVCALFSTNISSLERDGTLDPSHLVGVLSQEMQRSFYSLFMP